MPHLAEPWSSAAFVAAAFAVAWAVARLGTGLVTWAVERSERRAQVPGGARRRRRRLTGPAGTARRETVGSVVRTSLRLVAYLVAIAVSVSQLAGLGRGFAITWASVAVVVIGFALQRLLTDLLTGFFMLFEDWYSVGDAVTIEPWDITGVVEEISLRATVVRTPSGELARVHNSQVMAVRTLPRGMRTVRLELLVADEEAGRDAVDRAAAVMPVGPTAFGGPPRASSSTDRSRWRSTSRRCAGSAATWGVTWPPAPVEGSRRGGWRARDGLRSRGARRVGGCRTAAPGSPPDRGEPGDDRRRASRERTAARRDRGPLRET